MEQLKSLFRLFNYETQLLLVFLDLDDEGLCYVTSITKHNNYQ